MVSTGWKTMSSVIPAEPVYHIESIGGCFEGVVMGCGVPAPSRRAAVDSFSAFFAELAIGTRPCSGIEGAMADYDAFRR